MKKILLLSLISFYCTQSFAKLPIINNSLPLNTLPIEVLTVVQEEIINACHEKASKADRSSPRLTFDSGFIGTGDINGDGLVDYAIKSYDVTCEIIKGVYPTDESGKNDYGTLNILFQNRMGGFDHVVKNYQLNEELWMSRVDDTYAFGNYNDVNYIKWDKAKQELIYTNNMADYKKIIPLSTSKSLTRTVSNYILWKEI
ncbi:hypothetical protein HLH17_02165 [Acinetobacter sp. ANC 5380]|uniref:Uncharacterized protein n=1 Tax=Acinetobacter terrae TaxID=2731247 RepID=A0A7Y2W9L3_9GAMM|nr:hypothetical protein [Acinetobacter terrae]NNH76506.1 hypothetical protein [Acinetobacter terrae]